MQGLFVWFFKIWFSRLTCIAEVKRPKWRKPSRFGRMYEVLWTLCRVTDDIKWHCVTWGRGKLESRYIIHFEKNVSHLTVFVRYLCRSFYSTAYVRLILLIFVPVVLFLFPRVGLCQLFFYALHCTLKCPQSLYARTQCLCFTIRYGESLPLTLNTLLQKSCKEWWTQLFSVNPAYQHVELLVFARSL